MTRIGIASVFAVIACASTASAQAAGSVGFSFQTPAAIGVLWHASDKMALHPELTFARTTADNGTASDVTTNAWGVALGAPFYMSNADNLRTYFSPRIGYSRAESDAGTATSTTTQLNVSLSYGAHYGLSKRLAAFAETGLAYNDSKSEFGASSSDLKGFGLRSSIGLVLYSGR
jgi:hypothetical protein